LLKSKICPACLKTKRAAIGFSIFLQTMKHLFFVFIIAFHFSANAQLANGSIAPDFTLTDYYGTTHNLYSYLNDGKTVFVEIFAAHCPSCWGYHQTNRLKNMYNLYGPDGTDEIMILALEHDPYNDSTAFTGNHDPWVTAGNWLDGTPYPIFNVEGADRSVFADYNVTYYPVIYKICPDKIVEQVYTSTTEAQLYQKVQACPALSIPEIEKTWNIYFDQRSGKVIIDGAEDIESISITNLQGQLIKTIQAFSQTTISVDELATGIYFFQIKTASGASIEKLLIQ